MSNVNMALVILILIVQFALIAVMLRVSERLRDLQDLIDWNRYRREV